MTRFEIGDEYATRFAMQTVGTRGRHDKLWVSAEELGEFNRDLSGGIEIIAEFSGEKFATNSLK